jgi:catechol 2,3-dioxygenase-like lactoylglutathione lyase family enzyme
MNTQYIVHPKLQHYGLTTSNLDAMVDWYRKVLGMSTQQRATLPPIARDRAPFAGAAFTSNDECHHRVVFFEVPGVAPDPDRARHARMQHIAYEVKDYDELLGTYARLKGLGILPVWAADHGMITAFYYQDPDANIVEINVNVYGSEWTATEHIRNGRGFARVFVDPEKMLEARKKGATPWELHERAVAGDFNPSKPYDPRSF